VFLTKEERAVIVATHEFYKRHKGKPFDDRKLLVDAFCAEWRYKINLTSEIMRHPSTRKRESRLYCVHDIITDYLLDVDQVAERVQEYPLENADKRARRPQELAIILDGNETEKLQPFSVEENAFNGLDPIEELFFAESRAETVAELAVLLQEVKENEMYYVNKYADETAWNEKQPEKKRTIKNVRAAIRGLQLARLRECKVCGGAFYAHDLRRVVCDAQKFPKSSESACEIKSHRKRGQKRDLPQKKAII
jgi:hypothetical protein